MEETSLVKGASYEFEHEDGSTTRWTFEGPTKKYGMKWRSLLTGEIKSGTPAFRAYSLID